MSNQWTAPINCRVQGCARQAVLHIAHYGDSALLGTEHLCASHGEWYMNLSKFEWHVPKGRVKAEGEPVSVVLLRSVFLDGQTTMAMILKEKDGDRVFILPGDYYTSAAVGQSLQEGERPGSHNAMAMLLEACGASLSQVSVDYSDKSGHYHTTVTIETDRGIPKTVDLRPSDALALAHVCGVPFLVNPSLLFEASAS